MSTYDIAVYVLVAKCFVGVVGLAIFFRLIFGPAPH